MAWPRDQRSLGHAAVLHQLHGVSPQRSIPDKAFAAMPGGNCDVALVARSFSKRDVYSERSVPRRVLRGHMARGHRCRPHRWLHERARVVMDLTSISRSMGQSWLGEIARDVFWV